MYLIKTFIGIFFFANVVKSERTISVIEGQSVKLECSSSFPPPWTWTSMRDSHIKTLAISGTKPHPKLNEPRYEFYQNDADQSAAEQSGADYFLSISGVKISDAGKFVCDGDEYQINILNVMR